MVVRASRRPKHRSLGVFLKISCVLTRTLLFKLPAVGGDTLARNREETTDTAVLPEGAPVRLIKTFGLIAFAVVAAMAFVGAASASAETTTQLCVAHTGLGCASAATSVHMVLAPGTVGKLLSTIVDVLCLNVLVESSGSDIGAVAKPQRLDATSMSFTGCGTTSAHSNCTVTVESLPDNTLLKLGLDEGSLEALNGATRLQGCGLGLNCLYDTAGSLFSVGAQHLTADETPTTELGGKFFCPDNGLLDGLLVTLANRFVLQ